MRYRNWLAAIAALRAPGFAYAAAKAPEPGTSVEIPPLRLEIRRSSRKRVLEVAVEKIKGPALETEP